MRFQLLLSVALLITSGCEAGYDRAAYLQPASESTLAEAMAAAEETASRFGLSLTTSGTTLREYDGHDDEALDPKIYPAGARTISLFVQRQANANRISVGVVQPFISYETNESRAIWSDLMNRLVSRLGPNSISPKHGECYGEARVNGLPRG